LQDWFQAESEVLDKSILAPLYRRMRTGNQDSQQNGSSEEFVGQDSVACETSA
jgi:hypothetical protein